jgi:hypothetical protein
MRLVNGYRGVLNVVVVFVGKKEMDIRRTGHGLVWRGGDTRCGELFLGSGEQILADSAPTSGGWMLTCRR